MANALTISVNLVDKISKPLRDINKQLAAAQAPMKRLGREFDRFKELSGINKVTDGFKSMVGHVTRAFSAVVRLVPALGLLTSVASLAGIGKLLTAWGDFGTKLLNTSSIVGGTVDQLQSMQNAARLAGSSAESMTSSIENLGKVAQSALSGNDSAAANIFQQFGVSIRKSGYQAKSGIELMGDAFNILQRLKREGKSASVISDVAGHLGISQDLIRLASTEGGAGLRRRQAEAAHFGLNDDKSAQAAYRLFQSFTRLQLSVEGFGNTIASVVGPAMVELIDYFAELINDNKKWIGLKLDEYLKQFIQWLRSPAFGEFQVWVKDTVAELRHFGEVLWRVHPSLKTIERILVAIALAWGGAKVLGVFIAGLAIFKSIFAVVKGMRAYKLTGVMSPLIAEAALATTGIEALRLRLLSLAPPAWIVTLSRLLAPLALLGLTGPAGQATPEESDHTNKQYLKNRSDPNTGFSGYIRRQLGWDKSSGSSGIAGGASHSTKALPQDVDDEIREQARNKGLDEDWMSALARTESGPGKSPAGAQGYMQIMPGTAKDLGIDPSKRHQNIEGGMRYFRQMLDLFGGNYKAASAAYNAGPNNAGVKRFAQTGDPSGLPQESKNYLATIAKYMPQAESPEVAGVMARLRKSMANPANASPGQSASAQQGNLQVTINAPAGYRTTSRASGNVVAGAPRVVTPMLDYAIG